MQTSAASLLVMLLAISTPDYFRHAAAAPSESNTGQAIHWGYGGKYGPSNWSYVNENCAKSSQSPIDIITGQTVLGEGLDEIMLTASGNQDSAVATNNGHTVNLELSTTFRLSGGKLGSSYRVAGLHFHWGHDASAGSEHTVNGKHYPLEMHVVSYDEDKYDTIGVAMKASKGLAVIGLFFEISSTPNPHLQKLVDYLSQVSQAGNITSIPSFDVKKLLPMRLAEYYRYSGSLTTPACYESVIWTVLRNVATVSQEQLDSFRSLQEEAHGDAIHKMSHNWRPTQPLNGRVVYRSFVMSSMEGQAPSNTAEGQEVPGNSATSMLSTGLFSSIGAVLTYFIYTAVRAS